MPAPRRSRSPKTGLTKKEQAEITRGRVIDAAITLFAKRGFASTSTQDIARAIGMTPGTLYWHFDGKEALLVAVLEELERRLFGALTKEEARIREGLTAAEIARALIGRVARVIADSQETLLLVGVIGAEATDTNPRVERALRASYGRIALFVKELLERGVEDGAAFETDVECAAEMFLGMYMGAIMHQRLFRADFPLERALPVIERMLFAALMPQAAVAIAR
jgi:AcrR family transcriptional regulator